VIHHPQLALKVETASHLADEDDTNTQLLVASLEAVQKNPQLNSFHLLSRWHGTDQGRLLTNLAGKEWLINHENLEQQFFDTITSLSARQRVRKLEQLQRKLRQNDLSAEETSLLLELLKREVPASNPTSTGA